MDPEPARFFLNETLQLISLVSLSVISLMLLALFSATEVAYFSTSKERFKELISKFPKQADKYQKLLNRPLHLQATINFSSVLFKILFVLSLIELKWFFIDIYIKPFWSMVILFVVMIFGVVFLGELMPRMYAYRNSNVFIKNSIPIIQFFTIIFTPITFPLRKISSWISKRFSTQENNFTVEQLSQALEMTDYKNSSEEEQKILEGIVSFGTTEVSQVMTPRIDVFALNEAEFFQDILVKIVENGYSRIPVYRDNIDQIIGVLFIKDLLPHVDKKDFDWISILRDAYFIPENKKLDDLLKDFQTTKKHLAVVVDEFGETSGIITLEDVLEEIVGEIADEFDEEEIIYLQVNEKEYEFDGKISLKDFYRIANVDEELFESVRRDAESLAGFLLEQVEEFPKQNDVLEFANCMFTIILADKRRILKIKVNLLDETNMVL